MISICLHSNFSGELRKTISFLQEWRFSHSRSSKIIECGTNQKRVCDFLLVRNGNLGPILHRFGAIPAFMCSWPHPYSTLILGVLPMDQIAHVGVNVSRYLKLFGHEIIFEVFQPMWSRYLNVTDRRMDGQMDRQTTHNLIATITVVLDFQSAILLCMLSLNAL